MHLNLNARMFCLILALVLAILAAVNVPSRYVNLLAAAFAAYLVAVFFT